MAGGGLTLEYTPTWVVAGVCLVIVAISLAVERFLHSLGKKLKKKNQKPLFEALQKIKEELMLLGFISLLLTVLQTSFAKICMPKRFGDSWLPCAKEHHGDDLHEVEHSQSLFSLGRGRHLAGAGGGYCENKGMIPLLSLTALHHLHIFIFVLACAHVTFCSLTILLGGMKIQLWKSWEDAIQKQTSELTEGAKITNVQEHAFIKDHFSGHNDSAILCWLHSFFKQFIVSVTRADYITLRLGFIMTHCRGNPKFNFHNYMVRALEHDFKKVVGISWYLWAFVVFFLLLNVSGWNSYFWIMFIPFFLLLAVGTKLEHVISQLAREVAEKHIAIEGDLVVQPSDEHFWFRRPKLVLQLIHIILFQNSFELAYLFWILMQYGFHSCIMGRKRFIFPRLILGLFIQFLCSFSTLPLYAIVTQMGSSFKKEAIFEERVREGLVGWAQKAKKNTGAAAKAAAHK